ncbi:hypothetical protein ACE6H2_025690 [Prunus campanulata]
MATPFIFLFFFILLCKHHMISSSTCTFDFTRFPYEAQSQCFDLAEGSFTPLVMQSCCSSALQSLYQAMTIKASQSRSMFLEFAEAQNCTNIFQNLHHRANLNNCDLQDFISSSTPNLCSNNVDSVIGLLGVDMYNALRSNCKGLSSSNHSDEACFNCVVSYRQSLQALKERNRSGNRCAEALLVSLASSDAQSPNLVRGTFSCLWNEIKSPWPIGPTQNQNKAHILGSKKLLAIVILAAALVIITPILYKITRKQLQYASKKDIEILSVSKKTVEEESRGFFNCSGLYLFSQDEVLKATNHFDDSNLIGEATLGEHCLVYEYCVNGNLAGWLLGKSHYLAGNGRTLILTWEHRMQISIGIARGLCFLHANALAKMVHGDLKLSNIFLNEKLEAKILDSNLSNCKPNETKGLQTIKYDVFDFGVVLLQVLTGKKSKSVVEEARDAILKGASISGMADPRLNGAYVSSEFRNVLSIAVRCTAPSERERPYIEEIVRKLEETQSLV